ncbi:hypothetical protein DRE_01140 [Drechslerella stenobrocha 248]|uniref:NAD(P)-binding protein n=1 Tax=Drechslerella stenobrocha 248 TaxID=1043628 RepID=W7HMH2_9PEZI|nr:hypothetical protein DRE_01140 [Drechslerella stenobrocha 248]
MLLYGMWSALRNLVLSEGFPPSPQFEEKDVPDLSGKVYMVTGAAGGIGFELAKILYSKNAKVYIAGRSESNGANAIEKIKSEYPRSDGALEFTHLDLNDLATLKPAADAFLAKERRLDALVHNAGVLRCPTSWRTAQGWDVQLGTNVVGPFVLQRHLQNILVETAKIAPQDSVRVVFLSSIANHISPHGGIDYTNLEAKGTSPLSSIDFIDGVIKYAQSKAASVLMAQAFAQKFKDTGIIVSSVNPGNLNTPLLRHNVLASYFAFMVLYAPRYGGLTELFATLSPDLNQSNNGAFVAPWGRIGSARQDLMDSVDNGEAVKLWDWIEDHTQGF